VGSDTFSTAGALVSTGTTAGVVAGAAASLDWHWVSAKIARAIPISVRVTVLLFDFIK
jgi:hypothetical protein